MWQKVKRAIEWPVLIGILAIGAMVVVPIMTYSAVTQVVGTAGKANGIWNDTVDGSAGDSLTKGVLGSGMYIFNGTTFDRVRGTGGAINVNVSGGGNVGTGFFAVDRADITTVSVNIAFGLTSSKIMLRAPISNTDDICLDYLGATAVCPAANTAGDDRLKPGTSILIDGYAGTSFSVIAASGTQEIQVNAWN